MTKRYVVTSVDRGHFITNIEGVFDHREMAENFVNLLVPGASIAEYDTGTFYADLLLGLRTYRVKLWKDGTEERIEQVHYSYSTTRAYIDSNNHLILHVRAVDEEAALEVAAQRHSRILASGKWKMYAFIGREVEHGTAE